MRLLAAQFPEMTREQQDLVDQYRVLVIEGNQRQNLTRAVAPQAFIDTHLVDVVQMLGARWVEYPALDLGSGAGVPGLLAACLSEGQWVLAESESRKAEFLWNTVRKLGLESRVSVHSGRAEAYLSNKRVGCVVSKAVGPVSRLYGWLKGCSTWNTMILFKGPSWPAEWEEFERNHSGKLQIVGAFDYSVGEDGKTRRIIRLKRTDVPRGT